MPRRDKGRDISVIPMGALDNDPGIRTSDHIFTRHMAGWHEITDGLVQHPEGPPQSWADLLCWLQKNNFFRDRCRNHFRRYWIQSAHLVPAQLFYLIQFQLSSGETDYQLIAMWPNKNSFFRNLNLVNRYSYSTTNLCSNFTNMLLRLVPSYFFIR